MSDVGYATAAVLAAVFAWAGLAKLSDRRRAATTFAALGVPAAGVLGTAVPVAEVALAAGLLLAPAVAGYVALAVLVAFTTFLARALRSGVDVDCGCFGTAGRAPVGPADVVRNALLASAAVVATFSGPPAVPSPGAVVATAAAAATGAALVRLARRRHHARPRPSAQAGPA